MLIAFTMLQTMSGIMRSCIMRLCNSLCSYYASEEVYNFESIQVIISPRVLRICNFKVKTKLKK